MANIWLLHGPNLNLLGEREPAWYGEMDLDSINDDVITLGQEFGINVDAFQTNAEHEMIEWIHQAQGCGVQFILINPAAFTHTSIAIRDALTAVNIPFIEVHLSNPHARESFRHHSYFTDVAVGQITGFGAQSYSLALRAAIHYLESN